MKFSVTSDIKIKEKKRIGRNEPCWCGSGKKYKKCHLPYDEGGVTKDPGLPKEGHISKIVDWLTKRQDFMNLLEKRTVEVFGKGSQVEELKIRELMDTLIFADKLGNKTPFEIFVKEAPLSKDEKALYKTWLKYMIFSFFEITDIDYGRSITITNLADNKTYEIRERLGTYGAEKGMILIARIMPLDSFWIFSGGMIKPYPEEAKYIFQRNIKEFKKVDQLEYFLSEHKKEDKESIDLSDMSYDEAVSLLKKEVRKRNIDFDVDIICKEIVSSKKFDYRKSLYKLTETIKDAQEIKYLTSLYIKVVQSHPKFEDRVGEGEIERDLIKQFLIEADKKRFHTLDSAARKKEIRKFSRRWFFSQQNELGGKTPWEVILEERKRLGNPNKKFSYDFRLEALPSEGMSTKQADLEDKVNTATRLLVKEGKFIEAAKLYSELIEHIDEIPEPFRILGNIGACISYLGETEIGLKYFEKALELNPEYEIAKNNIKSFKNPLNVNVSKARAKVLLFNTVLSDNFKLNVKGVGKCEIISDVEVFINYIREFKPKPTAKSRHLSISDIRKINHMFVSPDPDETVFRARRKKFSFKYTYEYQYPKVNLLHHIFMSAGWIKDDGKRLVITNKGESVLSNPLPVKYAKVLTAWWAKTSWEKIQWRHDNDKMQFDEMWCGLFQNNLPLILSLSKEYRKNEFFVPSKMIKSILEMIDERKDSKIKKGEDAFFNMTLPIFFDKIVGKYFVWSGIFEENDLEKILSKKSWVHKDFVPEQGYRLTKFGRKLVDEIEDQMQELIPRNLITYVR